MESLQTYNFENNIFLIKNVNQVDLVIRTEIRVDDSTKNEGNWAAYKCLQFYVLKVKNK